MLTAYCFQVLLAFCCGRFAFALKSYYVTTSINAKWDQTPLHLEIAEYVADEHSNLYWDFLEALGELGTPISEMETDSKKYLTSMEIIKDILNPTQIPLLKLAVSMHSLTPRIQAHFQIAQGVAGKKDCGGETIVTLGNQIICSLEELKTALDSPSQEKVDVYNFDHVYPGTENNSVTVVLYGDIGSRSLREFHTFLKIKSLESDLKYISRHFSKVKARNKVRLSGYGVELHLKSTEYKSQDDSPHQTQNISKYHEAVETEVEGFDFKTLKNLHPELSHSLDRFRSALLEQTDEIAPLKAWEFQDLGLQAAERVARIQGEEALHILLHTTQNFPTQAKSLLSQPVTDELKKEMKHNIEVFGRHLNLQPPDAAIFVNGMFFDAETLDLDTFIDTLRSELRVLDGIHKINIKSELASSLLALDLSTSTFKDFGIDIRDSAITWINDIENDLQYRRWPSSVMDLLRPTFPGMLRNVRKNLFNLVLVVDPLSPTSRGLIKLAESFVIHLAPVRLGIVFDTRNEIASTRDDYRSVICAFNYISQHQSPRAALGFLTDIFATVKASKDVTFHDIKSQFKALFSKLLEEQVEEVLGEDSEFIYGRKLSAEFIERIGFKKSPQVLLNGIPLQENSLNPDDFEEAVFTEIIQQTPSLQKSVYRGELTDSDVIIDYLMNQPHIMPRLNQLILSNEDSKYLDFTGKAYNNIENINGLLKLSNRDMTATIANNLKYFTWKNPPEEILGNKVFLMTLWIFADLESAQGRLLLQNALKYMRSTSTVRIAFIPNTEGKSISEKNNLNRLVWAASQALSGNESVTTVLEWLQNAEQRNFKIPDAVKEILSSTELHIKMLRTYSQRVLNVRTQNIVTMNGKIYELSETGEMFTMDDYALMERCINLQYGDKIRNVLQSANVEEDVDINSDKILKLITILITRQHTRNRFTIPKELEENYSVVKLPPKKTDIPFFDIVAVLDPSSRGAQKITPILILLRSIINCNMRVFLCAVEHHSDMPVKVFYRYVVDTEVSFTNEGDLYNGPHAKFTGLPANPLFTQSLQVPENWLVEVVRSVYDLDNIKLADIGGPVHSEYELEYLLLEGHCFDSATGSPPRGLQITLGTHQQPIIVDTIVMANLGYFQLKANPGVRELRLRQGKSADIYDIASVEGPNTIQDGGLIKVVISTLRSHVIKLRVMKKPDKVNIDLLGDDSDSSGIWNSITSSFGGISSDSETETLNIFSVASGHLYERLLRIMMLSLVKHTKSPVKFWFLKNYLSPQFIEFLPHMAKEYSFQYELVQYKWPRWLHQQTEKQRTIWGYKILFLDVLFPLNVKKIIFVDADAVVRADLKDLNELDLNGAPYAYTPFCDSRKEMEGFRFWKQGYWRNHLMGRRYHISALYVVDLKRFRKIAAGDRLRGQYQALSQDPNSLSNLDQDLPNNMIHQVAIKSLPDEWLWCETWCSTESLKKAKVIDLCNNPMTKEAKLTAAQRIVPEWIEYDKEIKNLIVKVEDNEMGDTVLSNDTSTGHVDIDIKHSEL